MNLLQDIITYVRRILKTPSNAVISDNLIIDYINRFWIMDVDARIQLFDLKTTWQFQTTPGVDKYNMPLYNLQTEQGSQSIGLYPVYQGLVGPCFVNGVQIALQTQREQFFNIYPNIVQNEIQVGTGDGTAGPYTLTFPVSPNSTVPTNPPINSLIRGYVDISGIIATGVNQDPPVATTINTLIPSTSIYPAVYITTQASDGSNIVVADSGQFLTGNINYGLLYAPGTAPFGYSSLSGGYSTTSNTVNYLTGTATVTFPQAVPSGNIISAQCFFFQGGLPRAALFYNNSLTLRAPPSQTFLVEVGAYLSPAAFLTSSAAVQFGYMSEYIARGAARKILADTGDIEQFQFYEPLFREQEVLVWKRSQRQWTNNRTETIYSMGYSQYGNNNLGGSTL